MVNPLPDPSCGEPKWPVCAVNNFSSRISYEGEGHTLITWHLRQIFLGNRAYPSFGTPSLINNLKI